MGWLWPGNVIPVQKDLYSLKDWGEEKARLGDLGPAPGSISCGAFWLRSCSWLTYCLPKFRAPHCSAPPNKRCVPTSWIWPWLWDLTCFGQWHTGGSDVCYFWARQWASVWLSLLCLSFWAMSQRGIAVLGILESGWDGTELQQATGAYNVVRNKPSLLQAHSSLRSFVSATYLASLIPQLGQLKTSKAQDRSLVWLHALGGLISKTGCPLGLRLCQVGENSQDTYWSMSFVLNV